VTKLTFLKALTDAIARMSAAVAAIAADDYDTAERELEGVHSLIEETARELRAA
jgi:hypothetical protein